jgi:hypothetical protein
MLEHTICVQYFQRISSDPICFVRLNFLGYLAPSPFFGFMFGTPARIGRLSRQPRAFGSLTQIPFSP